MRRGEVWIASGGAAYVGKPRPVVIVQDESFDATRSITVCPLTTDNVDAPLARPSVEPSAKNGLRERSWIMTDKLSTFSRAKLGQLVGRLDPRDITQLNRAILLFLGLAVSAAPEEES